MEKIKIESKKMDIEERLFKMVFNPEEDTWHTRIYPVYLKHDEFVFSKSPYANFKSSTVL